MLVSSGMWSAPWFGAGPYIALQRARTTKCDPMATQEHRLGEAPVSGLVRRLGQVRLALLITALVFAALVQVAGLAVVPALIGFAVVALALVIWEGSMPGIDEAQPHGKQPMPAIADRAVEAIVSGLPDPTIA